MTVFQAKEAHELEKMCFSEPTSETQLISEIQKPEGIYLAVTLNQRLIAYVGLQVVLDEGYMQNLCVNPNFRKQGIAKTLVETLIKGARDAKLSFITLEVRESNIPAIKLYEGFGFIKVGERKDYYNHPVENAELMTLKF